MQSQDNDTVYQYSKNDTLHPISDKTDGKFYLNNWKSILRLVFNLFWGILADVIFMKTT